MGLYCKYIHGSRSAQCLKLMVGHNVWTGGMLDQTLVQKCLNIMFLFFYFEILSGVWYEFSIMNYVINNGRTLWPTKLEHAWTIISFGWQMCNGWPLFQALQSCTSPLYLPGCNWSGVNGCRLKGSVWEFSRCLAITDLSIIVPPGRMTGSVIIVSMIGSKCGTYHICIHCTCSFALHQKLISAKGFAMLKAPQYIILKSVLIV